MFTSKSQYHNVSEDPAHKIWLTALRVFAGLLHLTSNISSHAESSSTSSGDQFSVFSRDPYHLFYRKLMIHRTRQVHHRASDYQ
jgi:hypothetical protein